MIQKNWLHSVCLMLFLSGCSYNPFSSDNHLTGKPVGAVIGATAGMGTTALAGASRTAVALGGLGGAAFGYYVTTLDFISGGITRAGGTVFTQGDCVTISLPTHRLFESNSAELLPEAEPALNSTAQILADHPDDDILISGNSSGFGTSQFERRLTRHRASEVAGYLWAHGLSAFQSDGIKRRHLIATGYGERFPVANNITSKGIRANSRIQISACPSAADFRPDIDNMDTANVGSLGEVSTPHNKASTEGDFKGDHLPEMPDSPPDDFRPAVNEGQQTVYGSDYKSEKNGTWKEPADMKREKPSGMLR